jgi:hypothetical protein
MKLASLHWALYGVLTVVAVAGAILLANKVMDIQELKQGTATETK